MVSFSWSMSSLVLVILTVMILPLSPVSASGPSSPVPNMNPIADSPPPAPLRAPVQPNRVINMPAENLLDRINAANHSPLVHSHSAHGPVHGILTNRVRVNLIKSFNNADPKLNANKKASSSHSAHNPDKTTGKRLRQ
ncbi:uncharacterized protein LOC116338730 [Contarinia nasturtii]|uniref:uncharacterized protein LOC116338730 n=1 Tax=Contarinia nasturtii TaxID=265458 RepID=UPI0012D3EF11|nr:uncharacterized protein LOC116338730 [Contarinia nasturtii]